MTDKFFKQIEISKIHTSPFARQIAVPEDTVAALRKDWMNGNIQNPPVVIEQVNETYEVIVGGTRFLAAQLNYKQGQDPNFVGPKIDADMATLKLFTKITVEVHPGFASDQEKIEFILRENLLRSELSKYDQYFQFNKLYDAANEDRARRKEKSFSLNEFAAKYGPVFGMKKTSVYDLFELKAATSDEFEQLKNGHITFSNLLGTVKGRKPKTDRPPRKEEKNSKFIPEEKLLQQDRKKEPTNDPAKSKPSINENRNTPVVNEANETPISNIESSSENSHSENVIDTKSANLTKELSVSEKVLPIESNDLNTESAVDICTKDQGLKLNIEAEDDLAQEEQGPKVSKTFESQSVEDLVEEFDTWTEIDAYFATTRLMTELRQFIDEQMEQKLYECGVPSEKEPMLRACSKLISTLTQLKNTIEKTNIL